MKIKVGMYYRSVDGVIGKIEENDKTHNELIQTLYNIGNIKVSFSVIDLIKPQDLMYIDISPDDYCGIIVPRIAETLDELNNWKSRFADGSCILKSIITHEQLENDRYDIEGDKNGFMG